MASPSVRTTTRRLPAGNRRAARGSDVLRRGKETSGGGKKEGQGKTDPGPVHAPALGADNVGRPGVREEHVRVQRCLTASRACSEKCAEEAKREQYNRCTRSGSQCWRGRNAQPSSSSASHRPGRVVPHRSSPFNVLAAAGWVVQGCGTSCGVGF